MDARLVGWARAVKSRGRRRPGRPAPLWLFTDPARMPDLPAVVRRLPKGLCGVVFRHDDWPERNALARRIAQICRDRRLHMTVAGRPIRLPGVGRHRRGGRAGAPAAWTASAHTVPELLRAHRAHCVFISPVFPTVSHAGHTGLGCGRWAALARHARGRAYALGGIDGNSAMRLPRWCAGAGAIGALL